MPYQLILSEPIVGKDKDIGENVFINNLPSDYSVYLFYYPGAMPNEDLESKLRDLGNITGKNLFVNIGRINDPEWAKITSVFNFEATPIIIVTAVDKLATTLKEAEYSTAYVKIDNRRLLNSPDLVIECLQRVFTLFMQGKISEAMSRVEQAQRNALIFCLKRTVTDALKGVLGFLKDVEVDVSVVTGKFTLKHSGR